ncbi:MAG: carboxypeptidase-like regulatory domain-containing protein [Bacteroidota bacterium]
MKLHILSIYLLLCALVGLVSITQTQAQEAPINNSVERIIQLSGMVLDGSDADLFPVPYANISVIGTNRGTYSDATGFFSIVIRFTDTLEFSAIGYESVRFELPEDLEDNRYSIVQLMTQDAINLPEAVVFPWPSREHFKLEFLAMDVTPEIQRYAAENLAEEAMERMRNEVPMDGREHGTYYLRRQAREYYHIGQRPPMNIFNPIAWKQFFDAWKRGDFKKTAND